MPRYSKTKTQAENPMQALLRGFMGAEETRRTEKRSSDANLKRLQQAEEVKLQYDPKKVIQRRIQKKQESGAPLSQKEQQIYDSMMGFDNSSALAQQFGMIPQSVSGGKIKYGKDDTVDRKITPKDIETSEGLIPNKDIDIGNKWNPFDNKETPESAEARQTALSDVAKIKEKYLSQLKGDRGQPSAGKKQKAKKLTAKNSGLSKEDLAFTAKKHGITVEEVLKRMSK